MSLALHWVGIVLCFVGGLWIIVLAWQRGILWGLACLFIPIIQLIDVALNWRETKSAFFLLLAGFFALTLSAMVGP